MAHGRTGPQRRMKVSSVKASGRGRPTLAVTFPGPEASTAEPGGAPLTPMRIPGAPAQDSRREPEDQGIREDGSHGPVEEDDQGAVA